MASYQPDILGPGLKAIFCGINPATSAAVSGHNFSNPSNRFWNVLFLSGFTDERLEARHERRLLDYHCGITVVVRRPTRRASDVPAQEFRRAKSEFEERMRRLAPLSIAFLGKSAFTAMTGVRDVPWGRQPTSFGGIATWILPNPSGLNRGFTLDALVRAYAEYRIALAPSG
jgi:TDG/mug DNA glycosylase family protein